MLNALKNFFEQQIAGASSAQAAHSLELATAALLIEVARIDQQLHVQERQAVTTAIVEKFQLTTQQADSLIDLAEQQIKTAGDYYQFTSLINQRFSQEQKETMIERMWQVAYADQTLSAHEQHLIRKIAGLLHIPDSAYIAAKLRARPNT